MAGGIETLSIVVYAAGLIAMLGFSAAYNLWPPSPRKWLLRRFDHSAIFLFIAATYTPFIAQMTGDVAPWGLLLGVWIVSAVGILLRCWRRDVTTALQSCCICCWAGAD